MDVQSQDALRDALNGLAEALNATIAGAQGTDEDTLIDAKRKLKAAAEAIDNALLQQLLDQPSDAKLTLLAHEVEAKAGDIAGQEKNIARISGIATGVFALAGALARGDVAGALKAADDVTHILD